MNGAYLEAIPSHFVERRAEELLERGFTAVEAQDFSLALSEFRASVHVSRTAESLTYWGWMEHQLGNTERAIELCKEAIGVDPQNVNPYNDIGSYLIQLDRSEEAAEWFKKAINAENLEPSQFPFLNLAKFYLSRKNYVLALHYFERALSFDPYDLDTQEAIQAIKSKLEQRQISGH